MSSKYIRFSEKRRILSAYDSFQANPGGSIGLSMRKTMEAVGVGRSTIYRLLKERRENGTLASPTRSKRGPYKPIDGFDETVVRNHVHQFYHLKKQLPTLNNLHKSLRREIDFAGSRETLRFTLHRLGFKWKKTVNNRRILTERPAVVEQRFKFYERKRHLEEQGFNLVYIDETWIDTAYTAKSCWQGPGVAGVCPPCNRGQRLIVVHAGSRMGFVDGAKLVYKASSNKGDYHNEMDGTQFQKWLQEKLLPNLTVKSAIVMDNASYHSMKIDKQPITSWKKEEIKKWLQDHKIVYDETMLKPALLGLAKAHFNNLIPTYTVDQIIKDHGHEVLRLPPYHPDFNAIELIWSQLKDKVRQRNVSFSMAEVIKITEEAFEEIGADRWAKACDHVEKAIRDMKCQDNYTGERVPKMIIHVTGSSDEGTDTADEGTDTADEGTDTADEGSITAPLSDSEVAL